MFGFAHSFIAAQVLNSVDPFILLGSTLPDYVWNDRTIRYSQNIHYNPFEFYKFTRRRYPQILSFAKAVLLHSDVSHGLDWYSDDETHGYAMILGKKLISEIQNFFSLDPGKAADFAHNFIEAAFDVTLAKESPKLAEGLLLAKSRVFTSHIPTALASFSGVSLSKTYDAIKSLLTFYFRKNLHSEKLITSVCLVRIAKNRFNINDANITEKALSILETAKKLVYPTRKSFIKKTIYAIKHDLLLVSKLNVVCIYYRSKEVEICTNGRNIKTLG